MFTRRQKEILGIFQSDKNQGEALALGHLEGSKEKTEQIGQ